MNENSEKWQSEYLENNSNNYLLFIYSQINNIFVNVLNMINNCLNNNIPI